MFMRAIAVAGGLAGAAGLSQFPEFSQQYVQRLGGAVDELSRFIAAFDADAAKFDLDRDAALADLEQGGRMAAARAESVRRTVARHARLSEDLAVLRQAGPFTRAYEAGRLGDREIARATWEDFRPALPLTFEGGLFGGAGFLGGLLAIGGIGAVLRLFWGVFFGRKAARRGKKA